MILMIWFKKKNKNSTGQKRKKWYQGTNLLHLFIIRRRGEWKIWTKSSECWTFDSLCVKLEAATQGIKISKGVDLIFITRQEIISLPRIELIVAENVPMVVRVKYNEPKVNQQNGSIMNGVPRDWSRRIHIVNKVPRQNSPRCTYCH